MPSRRAWNCETLGCHVVVAAAAVAGAADDDLCGGEEGDGGSSVESRDDTYCVNHFQKFGISHLVYDGRLPRLKNPRHTVPMHIGYRLSCVAYGLETYDLHFKRKKESPNTPRKPRSIQCQKDFSLWEREQTYC